ncbi:MAG: hypothetical protein HRU20_32120 [Pseudomonadales bacterium]|nr:hypothetical protein [Pseudomonadales bacterium]
MQTQPAFAELEALTASQCQYIHTSGHAYLSHLKSFSAAIKPKVLIPIHTLKANTFAEHFENVKIVANGETYDLAD